MVKAAVERKEATCKAVFGDGFEVANERCRKAYKEEKRKVKRCKYMSKKEAEVYVRFMDLEKAYDMVNREALWQVLRMYDVGGKLLNGIKDMCINSLTCIRVKRGES